MISVIISCSNEKYHLKKSFDSLLNQDIGFDNLEVIFIDYGMDDKCSDFIQLCSNNYENVKVIFDEHACFEENLTSIALNHTTKEYLIFLNSNNVLKEDACKILYDEITKEDVEIVSGMPTSNCKNPSSEYWLTILTNPNKDYLVQNSNFINKFPLKIKNLDESDFILQDFTFTSKIYKKNILMNNSFKLPHNFFSKVPIFLIDALLNAKCVKYIDKCIYQVYHDEFNKNSNYNMSKNDLRYLLDFFYSRYYFYLKNKSERFIKHFLFQKLEYFLNLGLVQSNLSVHDILDLLIYSTPLFKSYVNLNNKIHSNFNELYGFISEKNYENALGVILGKNTLNQKDLKIISNENQFEGECNYIEFQHDEGLVQFDDEELNLFIYKSASNPIGEEILDYCRKNNIQTLLLNSSKTEGSLRNKFDYDLDLNSNMGFTEVLDAVNFKYIPYLKHIVLFYHLDNLNKINDIYNNFQLVNYPFKHLKLIVDEDYLFLPNTVLKSDLNKIILKDNYYFCFSDLNFNFNKKDFNYKMADENISKNSIYHSSNFNKVLDKIDYLKCSPVISVIIPVYNVEPYLKESLDSVCNQTFKDIEIICVNDGSTDNSLQILEEYKKIDSRISIISKENGGLSSARNVGLRHAKGEYIYFLDSDDYLELNALKEVYELSVKNDLDMLIFKLQCFNDKTKEKFTTPYFEMEFLNDLVGENVFNYKDIGAAKIFDIVVTMQSSFFRHDLISDMRFPEGLIFEDTLFFPEALFRAQNVFFYNKYLCNYRIREDSITASDFKNFSDIIEIMNLIIDLTKKYDNFDEFKGILYSKKLIRIKYRFLEISDDYKKDFFDKIKKDFLSKKGEYESDESFHNVSDKIKKIFYAGLKSKDYEEFEKSIED